MSLKWKILFLCLFVAVFVGASTAFVFAKEWRGLAQAYGISSLHLNLEKMKLGLSWSGYEDGWNLRFDRAGRAEWIQQPEGLESTFITEFERGVFSAVSETRLEEGVFELEFPLSSGAEAQNILISFRKEADMLAVSGMTSDKGLKRLSLWAAPFLSLVLLAVLVAGVLGFVISARLNSSYRLLERALEDSGAGRLKNLKLPQTSDPSVKRIATALQGTADVLEAKDEKIAQFSNLANEDAMTGVPNYRAFEDFVEGMMSGIFVPETVPALGIIDLDYFKKVNDTYGHQVGDYVLKETSRIVMDCIRYDDDNVSRSPDFFGRYGGEEFVVIFTSVRTDAAHLGALRILHRIKNTTLHVPSEIAEDGKGFELKISASIGLAQWSGESFNRAEWVKEADQALYAAKKAGRGRLVHLKPEYKEWT